MFLSLFWVFTAPHWLGAFSESITSSLFCEVSYSVSLSVCVFLSSLYLSGWSRRVEWMELFLSWLGWVYRASSSIVFPRWSWLAVFIGLPSGIVFPCLLGRRIQTDVTGTALPLLLPCPGVNCSWLPKNFVGFLERKFIKVWVSHDWDHRNFSLS